METKNYDFNRTGFFFLSVYKSGGSQGFGKVEDGRMYLNGNGQIAYHQLPASMQLRPGVELEDFLLTPESVHGIIAVSDCPKLTTCDRKSSDCIGATVDQCYAIIPGKIGKPATRLIEALVQDFKTVSSKKMGEARGFEMDPDNIWQMGYFEKAIRNHDELSRSHQFLRRAHTEYIFTQESYEQAEPRCKSCGKLMVSNG